MFLGGMAPAYLNEAQLFCSDNKILGNNFVSLLEDEQNVNLRVFVRCVIT